MVAFEEITLNIDGQGVPIQVNKISHFQSFGNYVKIITDKETLITKATTSEMEHSLPADLFIRVHKSFIINISKIERVDEDAIQLQNQLKIPIGKTFKRYVKNALATK